MNDYSQIEFVEARNAPNNAPTVVLTQHVPGASLPAGGRAIIAHPRHPQQHALMYANPGVGVGVGTAAGVFGRLTTGQVIDMVAQIFAALMPLPAAPNVTNDANTDAGNTILYQSALAQYAKRDEQVRTLGNLIVKLVG